MPMMTNTLKTQYIVAAVAIGLAGCSLHSRTDERSKVVVKLKDAMKELVDGSGREITWQSSETERYILFAGYMTETDLTHPEISPELRTTLADIAPQDERYALALINSGRLEDFTFFDHGWPRSKRKSTSPVLLEPCPLVMGGRSFKLRKHVADNENITLTVE